MYQVDVSASTSGCEDNQYRFVLRGCPPASINRRSAKYAPVTPAGSGKTKTRMLLSPGASITVSRANFSEPSIPRIRARNRTPCKGVRLFSLFTTATDRSSYEYSTWTGSFAFFDPKYPPAGRRYQSNKCQYMDGHALLNIHWMTPVETYSLRRYASNIARSPSYAMS